MWAVVHDRVWVIQGGPKSGATDSWPYSCQILTDLQKIIYTGRFLGKFAVKQRTHHTLNMLLHYLVKH